MLIKSTLDNLKYALSKIKINTCISRCVAILCFISMRLKAALVCAWEPACW